MYTQIQDRIAATEINQTLEILQISIQHFVTYEPLLLFCIFILKKKTNSLIVWKRYKILENYTIVSKKPKDMFFPP